MDFDPEAVFQSTFPLKGNRVDSQSALICHQHLLPSVLPLFCYLIKHRFCAVNVFVLGKPYSSIASVATELKAMGINLVENLAPYERGRYRESISEDVQTLWKNVLRRHEDRSFTKVILLDEGGFLATTVPEELRAISAAVEQTTSGSRVFSQLVVPTIQISTSAGKRFFESPEIGRAIWQRFTTESGHSLPCKIGIVGAGFIGRAIAACANEAGCAVFGYDVDQQIITQNKQIKPMPTIDELLDRCDVLFGCTGSESVRLSQLENRKILLISASSGDAEFAEVLASKFFTSSEQLLANLKGTGNYAGVNILNGGFPYNFSCEIEYENPRIMILTRLLMMSGIEQALELGTGPGSNIPLQAESQFRVVSLWDAKLKTIPKFEVTTDLDWWRVQSS